MQDALSGAALRHGWARPSHCVSYLYRYVDLGRSGKQVIEISGRDSRGIEQSGFWRTMTRDEIESDWIICDANGRELPPVASGPSGLTLSDLASAL